MRTINATSAEAALRASVERANRWVWKVARETGRGGMGATLTVVLFRDGYAYTAEVGDSRAYVLRGRRLIQLTRDQSYVQSLLDAGALTRRQADTFADRHVIMQAMGLKSRVVVVLNRLTLRQHDRYLLCSDGLSEKVPDREIERALLATTTPESACATLLEMALDRGGEDNVTVMLADVQGGVPTLTDGEPLLLESV
jgi:protein phosphatase